MINLLCLEKRKDQGCARFSEFWLFFTEQVFALPLQCYEKSNQGSQEVAHNIICENVNVKKRNVTMTQYDAI